MNYYDILEVSPKASPAVIRAAYRSLIQRDHPDKNPGQADVAARAAQVVAAYAVLSDDIRRAAYDRELLAAARATNSSAGRRAGRAVRPAARRPFWFAGLVAALLAVVVWFLATPSPAPVVVAAKPPATGVPAPAAAPAVQGADAERILAGYARDLTVTLNDRGPRGGEGLLRIPVIDLEVGPRDAAGARAHLNTIRGEVLRKLAEALATIHRDELLKADGESLLRQRMVEVIARASGTDRQPDNPPDRQTGADPEAGPRYGVVDVRLPRSYALR